jgi:hypothetical protein
MLENHTPRRLGEDNMNPRKLGALLLSCPPPPFRSLSRSLSLSVFPPLLLLLSSVSLVL